MSGCKTTFVRQQLRNLATVLQRFSVGSSDPCADDLDKLNIAEFGVNLTDQTLEVGYSTGIAQIPSGIAVDANHTMALVWNKTTLSWDFVAAGVGNRQVLFMSDLLVAGEVQLTVEQSGSIIVWNDSGTIRLPVGGDSVLGMNYKFVSEEDNLGADIILRVAGANFKGGLLCADINNSGNKFFTDDDDNQVTFNGTTTGGNRGTVINVFFNGDDYDTTGVVNCEGTVSNPFS